MVLVGYLLSSRSPSELYSSGRAFCETLPPHHVASVSPILHRRRPALPDDWAVKGARDIVSGLFVFLLMANGSARVLGEFLLVASLIALGDAAIVLRSGGSRTAAFGIHGLTALVIIAAGASLIGAAN